MALEVISVAVTVEGKRKFGGLLRGHSAHIADIFRGIAFGFPLTRRTGICETRLNIIYLRVKESVAADKPGVEHAERGHCLEALVGLRRLQSITATTADAEDSDSACVHTGILRDDIRRSMNILYSVRRLVGVARFALTGTLIGRVESETDVSCLSQPLAVESGDLLFHTAVRMCDHYGRISFRGVISRRCIDVGGDF